ncbi:MAG: sugar phosphate isomerase/epimerase [Chloroflexi bacterium]|nr:sugar phosphate isomerase/epimerase [Chloroflexota bacterium]
MIELGFALHPKWVEQPGRENFLAPLKANGMRVLEFTLHPEGDEWEPMRALAAECVRAGYRCYFHAPYKDPFNPDGFASARRAELESRYALPIEFAEQMARLGNYDPALVIHGAHGKTALAELTEDTRAFLAWVIARTERARLMLEILPPKPGYVRVGETYEQVVNLVRELNHPRLNICWDFGHTVLQNLGLPPADFLSATRHVHIHDLNDAFEDHFPLIYGNVPWQADLRALMQAGFAGAVVMEINGYRAASVENLPARLAESFALMTAVIGNS